MRTQPIRVVTFLFALLPGLSLSGSLHAQKLEPPAELNWSFDSPSDAALSLSLEKAGDHLQGNWRRVPGVRHEALEFDGYTTGLWRAAKDVPRLGNAFTVSAWVALNNYPWNWVPVVDQSDHRQIGFFFGIDAFGHVGFGASINGVWNQAVTAKTLPLKRWAQISAIYSDNHGITIMIDGAIAAELSTSGRFWQATDTSLVVGRVHSPEVAFPAWISHPQDPMQYSLDGDLDEVRLLNRAVSVENLNEEFAQTAKPAGDVLPFTELPSGPKGAGAFGALYASLHFEAAWDRLRRIGPDSDVIVRFDRSPMRLVFWQGLNFIPAWVTENGKWYTDEFLETWGPGCEGAGDCEPMSDKQSRYSHVSVLQSTDARAVIHWRYALSEARNYQGAHADPVSGWFDWADEYWTVYPDGVAVRKQVLHSSALDAPHEWQETIIINGPGQRPEDNIEPNALTLLNMDGESADYRWEPKSDHSFSNPKGPARLDLPKNANIQVVHLKSGENPFQIVWAKGVSFDTYNGEPSYSMFEWWNHWPVAQVGSSGRPALAPDRPSHTSLSHIYWTPWERTPVTMTKLLLCGLVERKAAESTLPLARSWITPPQAQLVPESSGHVEYDPTQRAFHVQRNADPLEKSLAIRLEGSPEHPLVNPVLVVDHWSAPVRVHVFAGGREIEGRPRIGIEHHPEGDWLIVFLECIAQQEVRIALEPAPK